MNNISEKSLLQALNSIKAEYRLKFLDLLLDLGLSQGSFAYSKKYYADYVGCDIKTIERSLKLFSQAALINKNQFVDKKTGKVDKWSVNIISINPRVYSLARYFKYKFKSLMKYLFFTYLKPLPEATVAPLEEEKDINYNISSVHPNLFINCGKRSSSEDRQWSTGYQNLVFNLNGEFERSIPDDHQLENFKKILELSEVSTKQESSMTTKEELFWDGLTKALKLSQHGLIKLQVFPATVVNATYKKLQQQTKIYDKVKWLIRECDNQCKLEGRSILWSKYYNNLRLLGIDQQDPLVEQEQTDFLDFEKPITKEPEVYSTRDLTKHKKEINPKTLQKGMEFLGDFLSIEIQEIIQKEIESLLSV